jgi:hypothetical protein
LRADISGQEANDDDLFAADSESGFSQMKRITGAKAGTVSIIERRNASAHD